MLLARSRRKSLCISRRFFRNSCCSCFVISTKNGLIWNWMPNNYWFIQVSFIYCRCLIYIYSYFLNHRLTYQPACAVIGATLNQSRSISLATALFNVRCHFPRPDEVKRITRHGWKHRLSTKKGRKILMRRILKNRHVLSHWMYVE